MKLTYIKNIALAATFVLTVSCGGSDDGGGDPPPPPAPLAATLVFPENNTECNEGTNITATTSDVNFRWNAATNADSYEVRITNLNTNGVTNQTTTETNLTVTIVRGTPYSWSVVSKATGTTETATSAVFKFYNAGEAIENYAPFPATVNNPQMGSTVNSGVVTLDWSASDIDNDITGYDIFYGTDNPPATMVGSTTGTSLDVDTVAASVYYWFVVTKDSGNNSSNSEVFQFRTN